MKVIKNILNPLRRGKMKIEIFRRWIGFLALSLFFSFGAGAFKAGRPFPAKGLLQPIKIRLLDGRLYFLDIRDGSVKVFSEKGLLLRKVGKKGSGPGENPCISDFYLSGANLYIFNGCSGLVNIYSNGRGGFIKAVRISNNFGGGFRFAVSRSGEIFISRMGLGENCHLIGRFSPAGEFLNSFLECKPSSEFNLGLNLYKNAGLIGERNGKIYFAYLLENKLLEFSKEGRLLRSYKIPLPSVEKPSFKRGPGMLVLERGLNYDLVVKETVYLLCRDAKGDSVIFKLKQGALQEFLRAREKLISFDISKGRVFAIDEEFEALVYK